MAGNGAEDQGGNMSNYRAAVLVEPNRVETWEVPLVDPQPGGVLVRVVLGGVCGSDVHITSGEAGIMPFPIILGHEGIGRVERVGDGVTTDYASAPLKIGDLISWSPIALCHRCYSCTVLEQTPCENSRFFESAQKPNWASYADYAWLPSGMPFFRLPDHARPEAVAALGCALPTVLRGFEEGGPVRQGDSVVVQGAGPVGLAATLVATLCGASQVIVLDHVESRLAAAVTLGATSTISMKGSTREQRLKDVWAATGKRGPNVVVEAAGALDAFPEGVDLTGNHGRYIVLGLWGAIGTRAISPRDLTLKNMTIRGATFPKPRNYHDAIHLAARVQERYPLDTLITHRFAIRDAVAALHSVEQGFAIKAVIDPSL
jgi:5-exo-hydroxycamphor dehydrogenase